MKSSSISIGVGLLCCLSIVACKPPKPATDLTGVFVGPVVGLSYETATLSGLTNERGEFKYKKDETVTFSIGGIALGSAPGAAKISSFNLFVGLTPPATELALRKELSTRKDVTDFDRAANIAFLLVSLDIDANPDNGLDLTGWDSTLAATTLSFSANLYQFAKKFRRFASAHNINSNVTPTQPLAHLYKSLAIAVPVQQVATVVTNSDGMDVAYAYDAKRLKNSFRNDFNNDGIFNQTESYTYTSQARVAAYNRVFDWDDNGASDSVYSEVHTYDSNGDVVTLVAEDDLDGNGTPDSRSTTTNVYNDLGELVSSLVEHDTNIDSVVDQTSESAYTYDAAGNRLTEVKEDDIDLDGNPDAVATDTRTYDAAGNLLTRLLGIDNDGVPGVNFSENETNTYDASGNKLSSELTNDYDNNGAVDYRRTETSTYNSKGNLLTSLSEESFDGVTVNTRSSRALTYNSDQTMLVSEYSEFDFDAGGQIDFSETIIYTRDAHGNVLARLFEIDSDGDGSIDTSSLFEHAYTTVSDGILSLLFDYSDLPRF